MPKDWSQIILKTFWFLGELNEALIVWAVIIATLYAIE